MQQLVDGFNKSQTDCEVQRTTLAWGVLYYTRVRTLAAVGQGPDLAILHLSRLSGRAEAKILRPIKAAEFGSVGLKSTGFFPKRWNAANYGGQDYAVPLDTHPMVMYYNKDLLQKAGLMGPGGMPKPISSLADFNAALAAVKKAGSLGVSFEDGPTSYMPWRIWLALLGVMALLILMAVWVAPLLWATLTAVKPELQAAAQPIVWLPSPVTFENFASVLTTGNLPRWYDNSVVSSLIITVCTLVLSAVATYALSQLTFPGRNLLFLFSLVGFMLPFEALLVPLYKLMITCTPSTRWPGSFCRSWCPRQPSSCSGSSSIRCRKNSARLRSWTAPASCGSCGAFTCRSAPTSSGPSPSSRSSEPGIIFSGPSLGSTYRNR